MFVACVCVCNCYQYWGDMFGGVENLPPAMFNRGELLGHNNHYCEHIVCYEVWLAEPFELPRVEIVCVINFEREVGLQEVHSLNQVIIHVCC